MNLLANSLLTTIIFILLIPGVLLSLPEKSLENGFGIANVSEIVVHGLLFFFIYYGIKYSVWSYKKSLNESEEISEKTPTSVSKPTPPTLASIASMPVVSTPKTVSSPVSSPVLTPVSSPVST